MSPGGLSIFYHLGVVARKPSHHFRPSKRDAQIVPSQFMWYGQAETFPGHATKYQQS